MEEADSSLILKSLLSGGLAGMAGKSFVAPLDRVKILLQTHNEGFKQKGVLSSLGSIVAEEGVSGLFRGNGVQMLRVFPYGAIQFSSYEVFKRILDYKSEGSVVRWFGLPRGRWAACAAWSPPTPSTPSGLG